MSDEKYRVVDACVVGPDHRHASFVRAETAIKACADIITGVKSPSVYSWNGPCACTRHAPSPPASPAIEHSHVFRDHDWGLGMFDDDNPHAVVTDGLIWMMVGTNPMEFKPDDPGMKADEARAIAAMLLAAADELEGGNERA